MALPINTYFDENYYRLQNPDVYAAILKGEISSGYNHFIQFGAREGRNSSQVFNTSYYLSQNPDVAAAVANGSLRSAYDHFLQFGAKEGRNPISLFNNSYYLNRYPDIAAAVTNGAIRSGFDHFLQFGALENRDPSPLFSSTLYSSQNPDVAAAVATGQISSFEHFLLYGQDEDRPGVPANKFNIEFDYSLDTNRFFADPVRKGLLQAAANIWESYIQDEFKDVPAGTQFTLLNPQTGANRLITLNSNIDDLRIYVGASSPPFGNLTDSIAASVPAGFDAAGSIYNARLNGSKFQPFVGSLSFNSSENWFFDPTPNTDNDIPNGSTDFLSTALHEIAHILGIGTAKAFQNLGTNALFNGVNAKNVNGGQPIPLESDLGHIKDGFLSDGKPVLMDPTYPNVRIVPTRADLALLADIGYRIPNFQPQGSLLPIATPNDDIIFGTVGNDIINGTRGNDEILGDRGADLLRGGADDDTISGQDDNDILFGDRGNDQLFGGAGDDVLIGGPGNDSLFGDNGRDRFIYEAGKDFIGNFRVADDIIQVVAGLGLSSGADVFRAITSSGRNAQGDLVSVVTINAENTITIQHNSALSAANFVVV